MLLFKFVKTIAKELSEKSPMSHNVVRNSVIFDPLIACQENVGTLQSKLKKLLDHLTKHKLFQAQVCDKIMQQFLEFVGHDLELLTDLFQSYKREETSLDEFYFEKTDIRRFEELASLLKVILTLSHNQAVVERGVSINNSLSIVNISEKSLVCKKLVKDHLLSNWQEAHTVPITNQLIRSVAKACQKYKESLEEERKRKKEDDLTKEKKVTDEITVLVQQREKLQKLHENLDAEFVSLMKQAEDKNDMTVVVKGDALKRSEQALEDTKVLDESIELLKEKRQKMH